MAGPKRPQDRIDLGELKAKFTELFAQPVAANGFAKKPEDLGKRFKAKDNREVGSGDVLIAAITSCTNTSNPSVMLAAGLLAKKAVEKGLAVKPHVKTSLAPGSRVVTEYLTRPACCPTSRSSASTSPATAAPPASATRDRSPESLDEAIVDNDLVCAAVLSGNRNFEARIHPNLNANFLASPPLVVAYAIAGTVLKDLMTEPLGKGKDGPVYLGDIWPTSDEVHALHAVRARSQGLPSLYADFVEGQPDVGGHPTRHRPGLRLAEVHLHREPPFFDGFGMSAGKAADVKGARALGVFGDSITTDHISPAGAIKETSPAGKYLLGHGVQQADFNSYGSRRGNHEVMMRGTFANVRIKNLMVPARADGARVEGGVTLFQPARRGRCAIYDAAMKYIAAGHADDGLRRRGVRHRLVAATGPPRAPSCSASRR